MDSFDQQVAYSSYTKKEFVVSYQIWCKLFIIKKAIEFLNYMYNSLLSYHLLRYYQTGFVHENLESDLYSFFNTTPNWGFTVVS